MRESIPSLLSLSLLKVATSLWNQRTVLKQVFENPSWIHNEIKVVSNAERLQLPLSLKRRVAAVIKSIGIQIGFFVENHNRITFKDLRVFCWTARGTIDKQRTAKALIQNENIDIVDRYGLACSYCLVSEMYTLWNRLDLDYSYKLQTKLLTDDALVAYWTFRMDPNLLWLPCADSRRRAARELQKQSSNMLLLKKALKDRNLVAVKYFWPKLATRERTNFSVKFNVDKLCRSAGNPPGRYTDMFYFLFSSMDPPYQTRAMRKYSFKILLMFLDWPWRDLFLEFAKLSWDFLSREEFVKLLQKILFNQKRNYEDYSNLFNQYWAESPISFRKSVVENEFRRVFLSFELNDEAKITLFFKDSSSEEKERVIFSNQGMCTCKNFGFLQHWALFKRFVTECLVTVQSVVNFKRDFEEFVLSGIFGKKELFQLDRNERQLLEQAFRIFDSLLKKRSHEEDSCKESKRCHINHCETGPDFL